ncbi:hypothetical protein G6011_05987 [Alternaria panax]|uniref:Secreted protein n=1 Tax=Alternaria panax TaxID=48097 RepID=A0AAD4I9L9_9PLEO|nr:hypothetical protein G6011_05987 [Alternaria panax]
MKLLSAIFSLVVLTTAAPSLGFGKRQETLTGPFPSQGPVECGVNPDQTYCFDEVVWGRGQDYQTTLHNYCQYQYADDALSCHGCMRQPFPTDNCAAAPGAWNSAFFCTEGIYKFAFRCENWCKEGTCV